MFRLAQLEAASEPVVAAALLEQATAIEPRSSGAHRLLGRVLISMGERAAGRAQLRMARRG